MPATLAPEPRPDAPTAKQISLLADLAAELGRELEAPSTRKQAAAIIAQAIDHARGAGTTTRPTAKQLRLLERLGEERGRAYQAPATRKQASARIAQILRAHRPQAPQTATEAA